MRSITESYTIIVNRLKELKYPLVKYLNKPLSNKSIIDWEDKFQFKFNNELKELYKLANGTAVDENTQSGLIGLIPIHLFLNMNDSLEYYKSTIDYSDIFTHWETEFKPGKKLFPFLEDGAGNCYWLDLNQGTPNYGKIFWTNTYDESPDYLYNSLTNFMQVISESYEKGIMFLDEEGYLDCDYEAFDDLSANYNSELDYWLEEEE